MCTTAGTNHAVPVMASAEETGPLLTIPLEPVDAVSVTTLVDNVTDLLAMDTGSAKRPFIGDATRGSSPLFEDGWLYEGWSPSTVFRCWSQWSAAARSTGSCSTPG